MKNIKQEITKKELGYILGSNKMKMEFLIEMKTIWNVPTRINRKGVEVIDTKSTGNLDEYIISNWDYDTCRVVLRNMFKNGDKYQRGKEAKQMFNHFKTRYNTLGYSDYKWPFMSNSFDSYIVRKVVYPSVAEVSEFSNTLRESQKDLEKFSFLKIFNTLRNDYIEYLIFNADEEVIPTFSHRGGIDFFIHGVGFDQKVSRSVTNQFMDAKGDNWRESALENPYEVAKYLMELGDESRFSNVPRLFVIDVDGSYELDGVEGMVSDIQFDNPVNVTYHYNHKSTGIKEYECPVICLMLTSEKELV